MLTKCKHVLGRHGVLSSVWGVALAGITFSNLWLMDKISYVGKFLFWQQSKTLQLILFDSALLHLLHERATSVMWCLGEQLRVSVPCFQGILVTVTIMCNLCFSLHKVCWFIGFGRSRASLPLTVLFLSVLYSLRKMHSEPCLHLPIQPGRSLTQKKTNLPWSLPGPTYKYVCQWVCTFCVWTWLHDTTLPHNHHNSTLLEVCLFIASMKW